MDSKLSRVPVSQASPRVLVAQIGARRRYAVPRGLADAGYLHGVITDACDAIRPWSYLRLIPSSLRPGVLNALLDRRITGVRPDRIQGCLGFVLRTRVAVRRAPVGEVQASAWARQNAAFCSDVVRLDWRGADTIYAFNGAALEIFQRARQLGLRCILDQTAAPWRYNTQLLRQEQTRWPGWEDCPSDVDPRGHMMAREEAEWELADRIICGSPFVVDALRQVGGPADKCRVVRYPRPDLPVHRTSIPRFHNDRLRVLFVGTLQLRKGIQYVCDTAAQLDTDDFEFRAVGCSNLTPQAELFVRSRIDWQGSVRTPDVWAHYRWADVFLLPTLSEGSANVCWEAVHTGISVVTTAAAGLVNADATIVPLEPSVIAAQLRVLAHKPRQNGDITPHARSLAEYGTDLVHSLS